VLIEALYGGKKTSQFIETEVKFEDGRRARYQRRSAHHRIRQDLSARMPRKAA
jgi:hypothetical protein